MAVTVANQTATPQLPATGYSTLYPDNTGLWQSINAAGVILPFTPITISEAFGSSIQNVVSTTFVTLDAMTSSLLAGTYFVIFNASVEADSTGVLISAGIFSNAIEQSNYTKTWHNLGGHTHNIRQNITVMGLVTLATTQTVDIRWKVSSGDADCFQRNTFFIKIA